MIKAHYINPLMQYWKLEFDLVIESETLGNQRVTRKFNDDVTEAELIEDAAKVVALFSEEFLMNKLVDFPDYVLEVEEITVQIDWPPSRRVS